MSFPAFHIPLIFARLQLKISKICTLFQPIKLQVFCILTIVIIVVVIMIIIIITIFIIAIIANIIIIIKAFFSVCFTLFCFVMSKARIIF